MARHNVGSWWPLLLLLAFMLQVPADAANREHQQLAADLRMLQEQVQLLQNQNAALSEAVKTLAATLDEQGTAVRKSFADSRLQLDGVSGDVRVVREKVDETNVRISSLTQEIEALRLAIPPPAPPAPAPVPDAGAPAPGAPPAMAQPSEAAQPTAAAPAAPSTAGLHPQKMHDTAFADYAAGQYDLAIAGFEGFLKAFPTSPLAADAQFYIGKALAAQNKHREALGAFDKVIANYPASPRVPSAHYERALALEQLGQVAQAREAAEFVIKNYPESSPARLAKQVLDRLNRR